MGILLVSIFLLPQLKRLFFGQKSSEDVDRVPNPKNDYGSSLSEFEAKQKADALFTAMRNMGTDEDLIYSVFEGLTQADYAKVYNAFGLRPYNSHLGEASANLSKERDLNFWLLSELSSSERNKLEEIVGFELF
ncbi:hypothetical protein [Muricauda sp. MAR_2010_75]|uniref:hypothetical protein n=1 Tax=Allomuricauda sp. MAR_2010_75 TaxID=1250232 RepID=UPI0012E03532|nr:hypothetical protein [Muricauda sp. MAR_2010_75]